MMQGNAFIFFVIFALAQVGMYISLRRQWIKPEITAAVGVIISISAMVLSILGSESNGQSPTLLHGLFFGLLIGSVISGATLATAWYFHSSELRSHYIQQSQDNP